MSTFTLQNYVDQVQSLIHDVSFSSWTQQEIVDRINDARDDVARDMNCVRSLLPVTLITGQEIYPYNDDGIVAGARIVWTSTTFVGSKIPLRFSPAPRDGTTAEGFGVIQGGRLVHIILTKWGRGYDSPPDIDIPPASVWWINRQRHEVRWQNDVGEDVEFFNSAGAGATAIVFDNLINVLSISVIWNTRRYTLSFQGFTVFQAWARMLQAQGWKSQPAIWTIHQQERLVYVDPPPNQHYLSEWDVVRQAQPLSNLGDIDTDIPDPWAAAVQFKAAEYLLMKHQNFGQVTYYAQKYDSFVPRIIAGAGGVRVKNPYNRAAVQKMRRA